MVTLLVTNMEINKIKYLKNNDLKNYVMRIIRIIHKAFYFDIIDPINPLLGFI